MFRKFSRHSHDTVKQLKIAAIFTYIFTHVHRSSSESRYDERRRLDWIFYSHQPLLHEEFGASEVRVIRCDKNIRENTR